MKRSIKIEVCNKDPAFIDMDTDVFNHSNKPEKPKEPEESEEPELSKKAARKRKFFKKTEELQQQKTEKPEVEEEILILHVPTFLEYFGYAMCPGTTVFGPWVPYKDYLAIYINPRWVRFQTLSFLSRKVIF